MTPEEERYLAEIEKLIKRKIPVETLELAGFSAGDGERPRRDRDAPPRRRSDERPERTDRERADRDRATERPRARPSAALPGYSNDPFFFKPYESAEAAAPAQPAQSGEGAVVPAAPTAPVRKRVGRVVAALLGGGPKR
jgi:superfamily II DNA/RNA helicase